MQPISPTTYKPPFYFSPTVKAVASGVAILANITSIALMIFSTQLTAFLVFPIYVVPIAFCTISVVAIASTVFLAYLQTRMDSEYKTARNYYTGTPEIQQDKALAFEMFSTLARLGHTLSRSAVADCLKNEPGFYKEKEEELKLQALNPTNYKPPFYFSPVAKAVAIGTAILGSIATVASAILYAHSAGLLLLPISGALLTFPPVVPIALCAAGLVAVVASTVLLIYLKVRLNSEYKTAMNYYTGTPEIQQDRAIAFGMLSNLTRLGHKPSRFYVARCLRNGSGCQKDKKEAFKLLLKIASEGDQQAQFCLSECYAQGIGCDQNLTQSFELLNKLASKGFMLAQFMLGEFYQTEDLRVIMQQNPKVKTLDQAKAEAIKWYTLVANSKAQGIEELSGKEMSFYINDAKKSLKELNSI